jgi:hypothetical protein
MADARETCRPFFIAVANVASVFAARCLRFGRIGRLDGGRAHPAQWTENRVRR